MSVPSEDGSVYHDVMLPASRLALVIPCVLALLACGGDDEGTGGGTSSGGGTGAAGGAGGAAAGGMGGAGGQSCDALSCSDCSTCATADDCMAEDAACNAVTACNAYGSCYDACNDAACVTQCATDHPDGVMPYEALISCLCGVCTTSCSINPLCMSM